MVGATAPTLAADNDFFNPIEVDLDTQVQEPGENETWDFKGSVLQKFKYGLDTPLSGFPFHRDEAGLSHVQTDWFQEVRGSLSENTSWQFGFKAEVDWLQWQNGAQQWEVNHEKLFLKDAFVDTVFANGTWVRAGHQIFAWSQAQSLLPVIDVLSPTDLREPGQAELQDIREQVPAIMVSVPLFDIKLSTVVTYDAGHNRYAEEDEEFYPYIELKQNGLGFEALDPAKQWELAFKLDYHFNGGDLSIVAADINDNELAFQRLSQDFSTAIFTQERVNMIGLSANKASGNWLLKAELGRFQNQPVANTAGAPWQEFDQLRSMFGVEYNGWDNWLVNVELNNIHLSDYNSSTANSDIDRSPVGYLFMVRNTALNDRLENQFWMMDIIGSEGGIYRWDISYDLNDRWKTGAAVVLYEADSRDSTLYPFQHHDSLNFSIEYYY